MTLDQPQAVQQPGQPSPQPQGLAQSQTSQPHKKHDEQKDNPDDKERHHAVVKMWQGRCRAAAKRQKTDHDDMRFWMRFAAGLQWPGQKKRDDGRYVANWTLREVNSKVASLYAKNPTAEYQRRKLLDFALYNGQLESLIPVLQQASGSPDGLLSLPLEQRALLADYQHGMEERQRIDRVGTTLEILFQQQLDEQDEEEGDFKIQMKQMARRTIITGVGFIRASFVRDVDAMITSTGVGNTVTNRALQIKKLNDDIQEGKIQRTDKQIEELNNLAIGLGGTMRDKAGLFGQNERIVYDCLPSTSVLVDPMTRALKGFIGASWVAIQYDLLVADANAIFEVKISTSETGAVRARRSLGGNDASKFAPEQGQERCTIWEVLDKKTRTHFYICDGYKDFLSEPEYLEPNVRGFWPIYALTFNDVEADPIDGQSPFPPSDVALLIPAQREYNRAREELKKHRKGNSPKWMTVKGFLTEEDKDGLQDCPTNGVVEVSGIPQNAKLSEVFIPLPKQEINPVTYDGAPMLQDAQLTTGNPQESLGVGKESTATGSTITEQNRMTVTASNIDDMDDALTWVARVTAEMMLQGFSVDTVMRIAGPGAVWPQLPEDRYKMLARVTLTTKAASSGRPNKAVDLRNWQMVGPILQQAGANPQFMVRQTLHVVDSNIDPEQAFPLMPTALPMQGQVSASGGQHQPSQQQMHQPGQTQPPQQSRPGPSAGQRHPEHQESSFQ